MIVFDELLCSIMCVIDILWLVSMFVLKCVSVCLICVLRLVLGIMCVVLFISC